MWSYYGSKANIVHAYLKPVFDKIIEPFAGTARYALRYWEKDVLLVDKYEVIVKIWKWLQVCSEKDVLGLPRFMKPGQTLSEFTFDCEEARLLMGFLIGFGSASPRQTVSPQIIVRPNRVNYVIKRISRDLFKIRHWQILHGGYADIDNQKATWYIDPPYQYGGQHYMESSKNIDFKHLSDWCKTKQGQTIVCETTKADWMDFVPMIQHKGIKSGMQCEAIWSNYPTAFDNLQAKLFE